MLHKSLVCFLICLYFPVGIPVVADASESKTVEEILGAHLEALGGREVIASRTSARITGTYAVSIGMEGPFIEERKRPNKFRFEVKLSSGVETTRGFDGETGWQRSPFQPKAEEMPAEIARGTMSEADMDGPLVNFALKGHRIALIGQEELDGRPVYRLELIRKGAAEGEIDFFDLDAETFLVVRMITKRKTMGTATEKETLYSDYRRVQGYPVAHTTRERKRRMQGVESVLTVEQVEFNIDIPDTRFSIASVQAEAQPVAESSRPIIKNDPEARALYDRMFSAMSEARSLSFESHYEFGAGGMTTARAVYKAWLEKPNFFRLEGRRGDGPPMGILVGDGERLWIHWPEGRPFLGMEETEDYEATRENVYLTKPTPQGSHSIGHEANLLGTGIIMLILDLSAFHGYTDCLQPHVDAVASLGTETVNGERCDVIHVSIMDGQRTWKMWLSQEDHFPRKLHETVRVSTDLEVREIWTDVKVNEEIPDDLFVWSPPEGWKEWKMPQPEIELLEVGAEAPDFDLELASGGRIRLSDQRGKVVLLVFWRVG